MNSTNDKWIKMMVSIVLAGVAASAVAEDATVDLYRVTVMADDEQGQKLLTGDYQQVIADLKTTKRTRFEFAKLNNLCVAHIMAKDIAAASAVCERAVSKGARRALHPSNGAKRAMEREYAVALTNRGVLLALTGETTAAKRDFERAAERAHGLDVPRFNLKRLEAKTATAVAAL